MRLCDRSSSWIKLPLALSKAGMTESLSISTQVFSIMLTLNSLFVGDFLEFVYFYLHLTASQSSHGFLVKLAFVSRLSSF